MENARDILPEINEVYDKNLRPLIMQSVTDYEKVSKSSIPDDVLANKTDYQFNYNDDSEWTSSFTEFEDSSYYDEHYTSDSDSNSSYDWDSGDSWDSGTTDWDSDW